MLAIDLAMKSCNLAGLDVKDSAASDAEERGTARYQGLTPGAPGTGGGANPADKPVSSLKRLLTESKDSLERQYLIFRFKVEHVNSDQPPVSLASVAKLLQP